MNEAKRVAIYARTSTTDQHPENQIEELKRYAQARGWEVTAEMVDKGYSGSREKRPALDMLMNLARKRKIDCVLVWKFDRFARSVKHLVNALEEFRILGVDFISFGENVDTSTPSGKMVFTMISAIAEFERSLIRERVVSGIRRAQGLGRRFGRPKIPIDMAAVERLRGEGQSLREIAAALNTSKNTVLRSLVQKPA